MVGANAVVCKDVPDRVRVAGVPAKILNTNGNEYAWHFDRVI
jgi:serine acetyltransferase